MRKTLTLLCMLLFAITMFAQSSTAVKRIFSATTGDFTLSNPNKTYFRQWKSKNTNPELVISCTKNNMWKEGQERLHLFNDTYTLSTTQGFIITAFKFKFTGYSGAHNQPRADVLVKLPGNKTISCRATSPEANVMVTNLSETSVNFVVTGGNVVVSDFEVELQRNTQAVNAFVISTTIEDNRFATSTVWYALKIGNQNFSIAYPGENKNIVLNESQKLYGDSYLWCFVGDNENGYRIYNRAGGVTRCLVAPKKMSADQGGQSFVQVKTLQGLDDNVYESLWKLEASSSISGKKGFYLVQRNNNFAANNRNGILAFWTGGRDHGSTFVPQEALYTYKIDNQNGYFSDAKVRHSDDWNGIWTSHRMPHLILENESNDMQEIPNSTAFKIADTTTPRYTLSVNKEFVIDSYSFDFTSDNAMTITPSSGGDPQMIDAHGHGRVNVSNVNKFIASFTVKGLGTVDNFYVTARRYEDNTDRANTRIVFDSGKGVPYRIPAITQKRNGDLIAVADYRFSRSDIGYGAVDLHYRVSKDNGLTWGQEQTGLGDGDGSLKGNVWNYAFGDAAIVADRTSDNVLVMCAGGHKTYFASTRQDPIHVARFRSKDGGVTWDKGENVTELIYGLYDNRKAGPAQGLFLTSGRIMQSRYVKVGDYYRLYIAHPVRGGQDGAYVIYSDDFGDTWHILGDPNVVPCSGKDESKVEELPDGSVLLSTRVAWGGRMYNIFTYTDSKKAEGTWGHEAIPENMKTGLVNQCNGAVLVIPAIRKSDHQKLYLALQSVPQNKNRVNVGFYYKELASRDDYKTVADFVKNWNMGLRVFDGSSCYSSMIKMHNDSIGFFFEQGGTNGYDMVFKTFSVDSITAGKYTIDPAGENRIPYLEQSVKADTLGVMPGKALGMVNANEYEKCKAAFAAQKTQENMEALRRVATLGNTIVPGRLYRFRNIGRSNEEHTTYLSTDKSYLGSVTNDDNNLSTYFIFEAGENNGWKIKSANFQNYVKNVALENQKIGVTTFTKWRQDYYVNTTRSGATTLVSTNPGAKVSDKPALSMQENGNVVPAAITDSMATWEITPVEIYVDSLFNVDGDKAVKAVCLPFAYRLSEGVKAYKVTKGDAINDSIHFAQLTEITEDIPAEAPVLWMADKDNHKAVLSLVEEAPELTGDNLLQGTIREKNVDNMLMLETREGKVGFYAQTDNTLPANGVYLDKAVTGNLYALLLDKSVNTGIAHVAHQQKAQTIYNLNGQRTNKAEKGIYIINGKKVYQ